MNFLKRIVTSVRYPESALGKTFQRIIPIILLVLILLLSFSGFAIYRLVYPGRLPETIDPSSFLLRNFQTLSFKGSGQQSIEGWFIPSVRGAPVVFLCHGYLSSRSELLTLASTFQENGYNLFLFDFRAHGTSSLSPSTLGRRETEDLLGAIQMVSERSDVNPNRVGLWGVSLGAWVALSAATRSSRVKTVVVDSPFDSPGSFVEMQTSSLFGVNNILINKMARFGLFLLNFPQRTDSAKLVKDLAELNGPDKLFITNEEAPRLESQTLYLFNHTAEPKELLRMKKSKTSILYDVDRKNYENSVVDFFRKHLPIRTAK